MNNNEIIIYTDGACLGNPGPGGYGSVLIYGERRKELYGGFRLTTNNRMELLAAVKALQAIKNNKKYKIKLHSDSRLLINAFNNHWLDKWKKNNWMRNNKDKVLNADIWKELLIETAKFDMEFIWVEGHAGIPENERCDVLSKMGASMKSLEIDINYENEGGDKLITNY